MLATRAIFARPATLLFQARSFSTKYEAWPSSLQSQDNIVDQLAEDVENTPSTNKGSATAATSPRDVFKSWEVDKFYSPLDFLRSRRMRVSTRRLVPRAVGPGAQESLYHDAFRQLDIDPVEEANNSVLLGGFMTGMGKVRPRSFTGLSWRSQRKVAQAIKRAKQKGIIPILSNRWSATRSVT